MATTNPIEPTVSDGVNQTSYSLIVRIKQNDPDAWERLVKLYSPLVYFWCQESGLPQPDLHDVFQEVFYALARNIKKFRRIENGTFRGWLRTLTRNKIKDHFRKSGREPQPIGGTEARHFLEQIPVATQQHSTSSPGEAPQSEKEIQHSILCQALANVRHDFAEQTWKAFWMVVINGRETNDVANDLSMRAGSVRVAKCRVLKRLRLEIGDAVE
jgi:RNA polymerase sigma-70 factor, ECF subfamily